MEFICRTFEISFLGMSIGGWIFSFFISCLASYLILVLTLNKEKNDFRKKKIEKLFWIKERMYRVRDWAEKVKDNINKKQDFVLDTYECILPKDNIILALQLEELKDEYQKIVEIIDLISIIENTCSSKRYLKNEFEMNQLLNCIDSLIELSDKVAKTKVEI